jgi:Flp pilus assembly protein TadD
MTESYNQAIEHFKSLDAVKPNDYEILYNLGLSQMAVEDYNNAKQNLLKAVSLKKGYSAAMEALLNILMVHNQTTHAISFLESQIKVNPLSPNLLLLYGTLLYNEDRFEDALTALRQVQSIAPDSPPAYLMEALVLKELGEFNEEVAKRYRDIAHSKTVDPGSQMVLARLLEMSGDIEGAKDAYRRVLELSPEFPAAANNLAWLMANDGNPRNLNEAMNLAKTAKDKQPTDPNFADTLGWVHYKQGQYYVAALEFRHAIDKSPTTPVYHYHLALALAGQEKKEDAVHAVKQSLMLSKSFQDRDKAEALYKKLKGNNFK